MFKNRKSTLLTKKSSELTTIRESVSDAGAAPSQNKIRRLDSAASAAPVENNDDGDPFGSQFSVPASQMNSQRRYLSQRSNLQKSQSARTSRRMPTNYFESVLLKCQLDLDDPGAVVLRCEPIAFVRVLRGMLRGSGDYPKNVKDFVHGLVLASGNRDGFRKLLECCQMQSQTSGEVKPIQESVMKMLLCVEFMQEDLIRMLFEYVERVAEEEVGGNMIGLVLSQIKFIDHTAHGSLVFNKYFEVLERSKNVHLMREAIGALEDVIDVPQQDMAFRKILELFPRLEDLFTVTNVTVFCEMSLSGTTLRMTRQKMVDFVENGCGVEIYPLLIRFMLKFNSNEIDGLHENIREIRLVVDSLIRRGHNTVEKHLREIFQIVYQALTVSAVLYEAWVKFCRLLTDEDSHMAMDLLVLLMMLTVNEIKSCAIQKILLNKIKKNHLTISHMKTLTKDFSAVLNVHMDCVLDFVESCLKEKQPEVCEFGVLSMSYLFSANNLNNRMVLNKLVGFMCEMVLINEGQRNDHLIATCMSALSSIYESYPNDVRNNAHILLKIMDISMDLNLQQYRTAVSLICETIHVPDRPLNDNETWDSLNIVIKKQLLSNNKVVKKKGVIGVVRLIRHLLKTSTGNEELPNSFDSDRTIDTVSDIPTASGREIGNMINLLFTSSNESSDILALCYDELAEMLHDFQCKFGKPEKAFTIWLCDVLTNEFQNYFIIEEVPQGDVVQYSKKLCINDAAELENTNAEAYAIAVNITENMLSFNSRYSTMCFFLSMFKLMKALQLIRYDGNLESINALLGCAIVVPTFYDEPDEKHLVETYEEDVCRQLLDAYFYIANWFRELINAFILQPDKLIHGKVLERITALVQLERRLAALLRTVDFDYFPPVCDFSADSQKKTLRTAKESSSKQNVTLNATTKTQLDSTAKPRSSSESPEFDGETLFVRYRRGFRYMDSQVIELFRESLLLSHTLPSDKIGECLGLIEYRFLLETVVTEIEAKTDSRLKLRDLLGVFPFIVENYTKINVKRRELHTSTDQELQSEFKALTCCANLSLRLFTGALILLKNAKPELRQKALKSFEKLASASDKSHQNEEDRIELILSTELTHKNALKDLNNAHCLYKFGCALNLVYPTPNNPSTIATFCQKFICSHFAPKTGTAIQLSQLLQGLFTVVDFPKIKRLTKALADDLTSSKSDEKLFSGLQRSQYALLFKELTKSFIKCVQLELRSRRTTVQKFVLWEQSSEILKQFSEVSKHADNFKIYSCYMKYSHTYLKLFQQSGLKTMEDILKVSADRVSHLLSTLQHSTRYLHNICCHSKNTKDNSLAAQIPFIRETVENLIYSVKAVLAANDCASVFWMGNLKNKDLKGDLIVSQLENELDQESEPESDIADFLSEDDDDGGEDRPIAAGALGKGGSEAKKSQSKCF